MYMYKALCTTGFIHFLQLNECERIGPIVQEFWVLARFMGTCDHSIHSDQCIAVYNTIVNFWIP